MKNLKAGGGTDAINARWDSFWKILMHDKPGVGLKASGITNITPGLAKLSAEDFADLVAEMKMCMGLAGAMALRLLELGAGFMVKTLSKKKLGGEKLGEACTGDSRRLCIWIFNCAKSNPARTHDILSDLWSLSKQHYCTMMHIQECKGWAKSCRAMPPNTILLPAVSILSFGNVVPSIYFTYG